MAASRERIRSWLFEAMAHGARYVMVVCDDYDYEDYPVPIGPDDDFWQHYDLHDDKNMERIMEVYDLSLPIAPQLNETLAFHVPPREQVTSD